MLKIGLIGAGHLGKIHLRLIKEIDEFHFVGFYDANPETGKKVSEEFDIPFFEDFDDLLLQVDVLDVVTPTLFHHQYAVKGLRNSKHVFIEKPIATNIQEAREIVQLAREANVKVQIGHVERFNPAFIAAAPYSDNPMFIETHRLAQFNPRGTDVSVVLDLMIHDIDIVLHMVKSNIKKINASGVAVVSESPDICNARIEFDNGCVANLTASRLSMKNMRKTRLFQKDAYISIDFLDKEVQVIRMKNVEGEPDPFGLIIEPGEGKPAKQIFIENPNPEPNNAIKMELQSFAQAIMNNRNPLVTAEDGLKSLDVAYKIIEKLNIAPSFVH